jgi:hypothetical protein
MGSQGAHRERGDTMSEGRLFARPLAAFTGKFLALYLLLVLPWPFLTNLYVELEQETGAMIFNSTNAHRAMSFAFLKDPQRPFDARITIVNPELLNPDGSGPVRHLDFDTRVICWNPCVLLIALIFASPVSWKRRWRALAFGLPVLVIAIFCFFQFCLWDESSEIGLVVINPFWKTVVTMTRQAFIAYLGLVAPVFLWPTITFRREDLTNLQMVFLSGGKIAL